MRILTGIDVPFIPFGGSLICCDDWYSSLSAENDVRFLTLPPPQGVKQWWSISDVILMDIEKARTPEQYPQYIAHLREIVEDQIKIYKPDVIHCQHLNFGLSRVFAELNTDIPRIGICHGTDVQAAVRSPFFKDNLTRICDNMDLLIFPNQRMADDLFKVYPEDKAYKINSLGIPDQFFYDAPSTPRFKDGGTLNVLYAGRLVDWKGADIAVEAMAHVSHDVHLTVIGNEDQANYKQQMLDIIEKNDLNERVTFLPQVPRGELLKLFENFDLMVLPSREIEAFSLTAVEAQARGLPIVYTKSGGGIVDTVGDGGIQLDRNTPSDLANLLDHIYCNPEILQHTQSKGLINAERYHLSRSTNSLLESSTELIQARFNVD